MFLVKYLFIFMIFIFSYELSAKDIQEWVTPTFKTDKGIAKSFVLTRKYTYVEYSYNDFYTTNIDKRIYYKTPEDIVKARFKAMQLLNYSWWLDCLDKPSLKIALDKYKEEGMTKKYWITNWKQQFVNSKIKLIKKIEIDGYVIITYKVFSQSNVDLTNGFELPIVLKNEGKEKGWKVTLDFRENPIVMFSPWVSGKNKEVIETTYF
ncbi:MAG: hypothetical protein KAU26_02960 [Methylococcales bacterium]|nr:hypothetical protein [Methylococcales bacterium]